MPKFKSKPPPLLGYCFCFISLPSRRHWVPSSLSLGRFRWLGCCSCLSGVTFSALAAKAQPNTMLFIVSSSEPLHTHLLPWQVTHDTKLWKSMICESWQWDGLITVRVSLKGRGRLQHLKCRAPHWCCAHFRLEGRNNEHAGVEYSKSYKERDGLQKIKKIWRTQRTFPSMTVFFTKASILAIFSKCLFLMPRLLSFYTRGCT